MESDIRKIAAALTRIADALDCDGEQTFAARAVHELTQMHNQLAQFGPTLAVLDLGVVKICDALGHISDAMPEKESLEALITAVEALKSPAPHLDP